MSTTETCFCGAIQLSFSIEGDNLVNTFVCNCLDCRHLSASAFCSNFTIKDETLKYVRGQDAIKTYATKATIDTGNTMTNYFCSNCGSLMYRVSSGWPGLTIMRIGQVDDVEVQNNQLRPKIETYVQSRASWAKAPVGAESYQGNYFGGDTTRAK